MRFQSRQLVALAVSFTAIVGACGGTKMVPLTATASKINLEPKNNGFSFANFGAAATEEVFNTKDLVTMFGASACVNKDATSCAPTAQAGQWAQMVNDARISGHCEGLAVQSAERFNGKATPQTVELKNEGDVTHGIMRAFATQFLPEVQDATNLWSQKSLVEIVNELAESFKSGGSKYTLGIYTETGGHAVLPFALEFPNKDLAVIKVYDSNWPGMDRYVVVDLKAKRWFFSFSGANPQDDKCAWTGGDGQMDITPIDARTNGTCPFCGDGTKVTKSVLFIRSTSSDWSLKTKKGTYSPNSAKKVAGVSTRAIRSASCDNVVRLPEFILSADSTDFELTLPDSAAVYVSSGTSVVKISTSGKKQRKPIVFTQNSIEVADATVQITIAVDNVIAQIRTDGATIDIKENALSIDLGGSSTPIDVTADSPQIVVTDTSSGTPDVQKVTNLVTVTPTVVPELVPDAVKPGLTPVADRDLSNEVYAKDVMVASSTTVPISVPPVVATTTTTSTLKTTTTTTTATQTSTTVGNNSNVALPSSGTTTSSAPGGASNSSSSSSSTTSTTSTTTSTLPTRMVTVKVIVNGTGWTPTLSYYVGTSYYDQGPTSLKCNSVASCQGASWTMPYGDYFMVRVTTDQNNSYASLGAGWGYSVIQNNDMTFSPQQCATGYHSFANDTCEVILYKYFGA